LKIRFLEAWRRLRSSFWFLPTLMAVAALGLAGVGLGAPRLEVPSWLAISGTDSARSLLATIAGSMITVAGVTFSVVIVALTLASSQYGPRLLGSFMKDTGNQVVLGTFVSVFLYCLVVLLYLPESSGDKPSLPLPVLIALVLAVLAVAVLIYFFHHISTSIQAGELVREAGRALDSAIRTHLDEEPAQEAVEPLPEDFNGESASVDAGRNAYLGPLDLAGLVNLAAKHDLRILVEPSGGDFVLARQPLARVMPAEALTEDLATTLRAAFSLVERREDAQDLPLAVERITEIGVRCLSPGINDPNTALAAIHHLTAGLDDLLDRLPADPVHRDDEGEPRVFYRFPGAAELLRLAYGPILTYGSRDVRILESLAHSLARLGGAGRGRFEGVIEEQIECVRRAAHTFLEIEEERARVEEQCDRARRSEVQLRGRPDF
jgi:uncharacterized membrane protein